MRVVTDAIPISIQIMTDVIATIISQKNSIGIELKIFLVVKLMLKN